MEDGVGSTLRNLLKSPLGIISGGRGFKGIFSKNDIFFNILCFIYVILNFFELIKSFSIFKNFFLVIQFR